MSELEPVVKKTRKPRGPNKANPRERSAAGLSLDEAHRDGITLGDERDSNTAVEQERVRIPLNSGQKQSLRGYKLDEKNFHYRWFHESATRGGRVIEAKEAFYEQCVDAQGNALKTPSGAGWDYLMRLPVKYWQQDMEASRARRERLRKSQQELKGDGKIQEYGVDNKTGKPVFDGETPVKRSSTVAHNPYSE